MPRLRLSVSPLVFGLAAFSFTFTPRAAHAAAVTAERIEALPMTEQAAWRSYLARSSAHALADQAALQAELAAQGLHVALRAPSGGDFKLPAKLDHVWYAGEEAARLADVVISYQTPGGGWSKHTGYSLGMRKPGMQWTSQNEPGQPAHYLATFDNRSTTEQISFLAGVWRATRREDCKAAVLRGLNFIFESQFPNGGWPQVYPLEGEYHDDITFNDDAMTHVLELLHAVATEEPVFAFVEPALRERAAQALSAGIRCLLAAQLSPNGEKAVWCAQYDPITLAPSSARKMEPATLSGLESAHIVEFLMSLKTPSPDVVASVESALAWLDKVKITTLAKARVNGKTVYQTVPDSAEVYWARFYDLASGRAVFPGRDGVVYDSYEAMVAANRAGYDYFTTQPGSILKTGQKKWRKLLASSNQR